VEKLIEMNNTRLQRPAEAPEKDAGSDTLKDTAWRRMRKTPPQIVYGQATTVPKPQEASSLAGERGALVSRTVVGKITISGQNAEVHSGDDNICDYSNDKHSYATHKPIGAGTEFKLIEVLEGTSYSGVTGAPNGSVYHRIDVKASDEGEVPTIVKIGNFADANREKQWFDEKRVVKQKAKEAEKEKERRMKEEMRAEMREEVRRQMRERGA